MMLLQQSEALLNYTSLKFKRFLFDSIRWNNRLIGIKGARGTGKTTLLLQWLKSQNLPAQKAAYFSLDDLYFTTHTLKETIEDFYRQGGRILVLDEVHKYKNWAREVKNSYDFFPDLKIIFTGSSIVDISRQEGDLSRRALMYELPGLSFREFLQMKYDIRLAPIELQQLLEAPEAYRNLQSPSFRPYEFFQEYLLNGYYPFVLEDNETVHQRLNQLVRTIVEYDMAELKDFDIRNAKKVLQLVHVIAQQVPFKPNLTALAAKTTIHRNSLNNYLYYLDQAKIITLLHSAGNSIASLQKPEKVFLNNTTLLYALAEEQANVGTIRETFVLSQLMVKHRVNLPRKGDFMVDNKYTFEVGGKNKTGRQLRDVANGFLIKDDIEIPMGNEIPLWMMGILY